MLDPCLRARRILVVVVNTPPSAAVLLVLLIWFQSQCIVIVNLTNVSDNFNFLFFVPSYLSSKNTVLKVQFMI